MQRLHNRVVVVTGAGSGLGLASARRMAAEGARIIAADIGETTASFITASQFLVDGGINGAYVTPLDA
jgi:NAD(P)-dependent dehydrogenase (short-subunit alcohol dehydrogenase family)